jgi:hypothetical protein
VKIEVKIGNRAAGWFEDARGFVAGRLLRKRYRKAVGAVNRCQRQLDDGVLDPETTTERKDFLLQEFSRAEVDLAETEIEVRKGWDDFSRVEPETRDE